MRHCTNFIPVFPAGGSFSGQEIDFFAKKPVGDQGLVPELLRHETKSKTTRETPLNTSYTSEMVRRGPRSATAASNVHKFVANLT